jgi:hypothetical protein
VARKRRAKRPQPAPAPRAAPPAPRALEPIRLPRQLAARHIVPLTIGFAAVVAGYIVVFRGATWGDNHPGATVGISIVALAATFALERHAIIATPQSSLRFAGFGVLAPFLFWFLHVGALVPLAVLQGLTTYRLGIGSISPPAIAATMLTGIAFGPYAGLVACVGHVWPGLMVLVGWRGQPR